MHATKIKQKVGNLGPHEKILEVGDDNHMLSQEGSDAPLWMNPQDRVSKKFSQYDEPQFKDKTKSELLGNLRIAGVDISLEKEKREGQLQYIYRKNKSLQQIEKGRKG